MNTSSSTSPRRTDQPTDALVTMVRHGKPPLRMRVHSRLRREVVSPNDACIYAELFLRPRGGVALAFSRPADGVVVDDAVSGPDVASACGQARDILREGSGARRQGSRRSSSTATSAALRLADRGEAAMRARDVLAMVSDLEALSEMGAADPWAHATCPEAS